MEMSEVEGMVYVEARKALRKLPPHNGMYELEDLIQEGWLVYVKATSMFDESRGVKFSTYLCAALRNKLAKVVRDTWRHSPANPMVDINIFRLSGDDMGGGFSIYYPVEGDCARHFMGTNSYNAIPCQEEEETIANHLYLGELSDHIHHKDAYHAAKSLLLGDSWGEIRDGAGWSNRRLGRAISVLKQAVSAVA